MIEIYKYNLLNYFIMIKRYKVESIEIVEDNGYFELENKEELKIMKVLIKIYQDFFNDNDIKYLKNNSITFKGNKIVSLKELLEKQELEYNLVLNILHNIARLKEKLEENNLMFININLEDIIVLDSIKFIFINVNKIHELNTETGDIEIERIIDKGSMFNPKEMKEEINKEMIPFKVNIKSVYYNIGNILLYSLLNTNIDDKNISKIEEVLYPIYYTKLYWFLLRCLNKEVNDRVFLFI